MDREREGFYDEEDTIDEDEQTSDRYEREVSDDTRYFLRLLHYLRGAVEDGKAVPLMTGKAMVDKKLLLDMIDDMWANLPDAIENAQKLYSEVDRVTSNAEDEAKRRISSAAVRSSQMIKDATSEADQTVSEATERAKAIIDEAEATAKQMVSESEIVDRAKEEARVIIEDARLEAAESRHRAYMECVKRFTACEKEIADALDLVRRQKDNFTL